MKHRLLGALLCFPVAAAAQVTTPAMASTPVTGAAGTPLTDKTDGGAVTLILDPVPQDGRLSIRVVAANFHDTVEAFGPRSFTLSLDGRPVKIADAEGLAAGRNSRSSRDSNLARAAAAPTIAGFGKRDTTQDDTPSDSVSGVPGEKFARGDRVGDDDEVRRLRDALLQKVDVPPHGHQGGAMLTDRVRRSSGMLDIAVAFAGDVYRFSVKLAGR